MPGSFRKSLVINFLSSSGATMAQFVISLIIARLLSPAEIGVYSIAIVLVNIAHVFRDFGVSTYLQREPELTRDKVRSAMGVAYLVAWTIALMVFLASGPVAAFFGHAEIAPIMHILAISFLFLPFSSVALALLMRAYDARSIAVGSLTGTAAYAAVSLGLAWAGFGARSLAWANLANIVATGITYVWLRPAHMAYRPHLREAAGIVQFGGGALIANLVRAANDAMPDLLLGKLGSARQVGLASRANSTVHMFLYVAGSAMTFGSQTYLAKAHHAGEPLEPMLGRAVGLITGVGWPMLAVTAVAAHDIIVALYGGPWAEAAPAVGPLALMVAVELVFYYHSAAFNAVGRPYVAAVPLLVTAFSRGVLALALFDGTIVSFAWALALATVATAPVWLWLQQRDLRCSPAALARALIPSAVAAAACGLAAWLAVPAITAMGIHSALLRLAALAVPTGIAWVAALWLTRHPLFEEAIIAARHFAPLARIMQRHRPA